MTHHITDEQIAKLHDSMFPAPYDGHANVIRFARAVLALAAPAPAVPSGWSITDNGDNSITVHGPGLGCTVSDVEEVARRVPSEVLYEFCRAMLTAAPTPPAQPEQADPVLVQHRKPIAGKDGETTGYTSWIDGKGLDWWPHRYLYACPTPAQPAASSLQPVCRYISEVLAGDAASGEKNIARTIMHLLPLEQAALGTHPQPAAPESADDSDGLLRVIASMGAALRRLSFAAQTSGGTAGPDAELMAAIGQAQQALSLGGIGAAMFACQATPAVPEDVARDAERYRWLRDMASQDWLHRNHNYQNLRGAAFDAAIDAARAAEKGGE